MDSPIHRFQREDGVKETSIEDISLVDQRLVSVEKDLKDISMSSAIQARDSQILKAKIETLEKSRPATDIQETLTRVYDHIEAIDDRVEQVFDRMQVLERRLLELGGRLDNLGEVGKIENLPALLEQSLDANLDDLESKFEARFAEIEAARTEASAGGVSDEQMQQVHQLIKQQDARAQALRTELDGLLDSRQEELLELIQESTRSASPENVKAELEKELESVRNAIAELQEVTEAAPTRAELEASVSSSGEDSEGLAALREEFSVLQASLSTVKNLFDGDQDWEARLQTMLSTMKETAERADAHSERVDLAVRLVQQLEEKTRNVGQGAAAPAAAAPGHLSLVPPPGESELKLTLKDLVREMVKNRVSDLHIKTGRAITARIGKELIQFSTPPLSPADSFHLISSALRPDQKARLVDERDLEFVYQYESIRLRANVFFDRGNLSATFKMLSNRPPELENLGLPRSFSNLLMKPSGLIVVCGLPGSGRTTTLTASLDFLNRMRQLHLVSLEDRLDFTHEDRRSLVTQREFGSDISSFGQGLRRALGQDSDVIFVADLADKDTMEAAIAAVESGLLVVGAMTAQRAQDAIPRLINLFPESERKMRAQIFSRSLQAILSLKLFERADGEGQIPASELLVANPTVKRLIEGASLSALQAQIAGGASEGMQTFAQSVERLLETGLIRVEDGERELERLGAPIPARVASSASAPAARSSSDPEVRPSGEIPAVKPASVNEKDDDSGAFGEEDTLMNWL